MRNSERVAEQMLHDRDLEREFRRRKRERIVRTINKDMYEVGREWTIEKEYKTVLRVSRPKMSIEILRDKVWCLLKQFGVEEMSGDGVCIDMEVEGRNESYFVDILAIDEEFIFAVVCKARDVLGEYPWLREEILEFRRRQSLIRNAIRRQFSGKRKVVFVLATENVTWPEGHKKLADENRIVVFDEYDLLKLEELTAVAGEGAKYQVYSRILQDIKIKSFSLRVPAIRSKMGGRVYYSFALSPDELLKIAYVHQRATECTFLELSDSYQRILKRRRIKKIKDYIERGGYFPGSIILNFNRKIREIGLLGKKDERRDLDKNGVPVILELPPYYGSAWVIDGQHRLYGYADSPKKKTETLSVVAFVKQPPSEQSKIFLDINQYQSAISSDLKWDLYEDLYCKPSDDKERELYAISRVGKTLNDEGPLSKKIRIPKDELINPGAHVGLETVCKCIQRNKFLNAESDPFYHESVNISVANCAASLNTFLEKVARDLPDEWEKGNAHFICTNVGVTNLISIFRDIVESLRRYVAEPSEFREKLRPFATALSSYIKQLPDSKIKEFREASVGRAQTPHVQAELTRAIRDREPYFSHFLHEYEKKQTEAEFEKYARVDEGDTFEAKGSLALDVNRLLKGDRRKECTLKLANEGVLKAIVALLNSEEEGCKEIVVGLLEAAHFPQVNLESFGDRFLLFGIDEEFDTTGWDGYERRLQNLIYTHIAPDAFGFIKVSKCEYAGRTFCIIRIPRSDRRPDGWYYLDQDKFYVRAGGQTRQLFGPEADKYKKLYPRRT